jgi:hypothetical protein
MNQSVFRSVVFGVLAAIVVTPRPTPASTLDDFLNAPVWYVQYEVSFKANHKGTYPAGDVPISFTVSLERVFSATEALGLRSQGPGALSMSTMYGGAGGKTPTVAEAQELSNKMMSQMEHTANWMPGAATDEEVTASTTPSSPVRLDYTRVDIGKNLVDESGGTFDVKTTTTTKGTSTVLTGGFGGIILEMDTSAKTYVMTLPFVFGHPKDYAKSETVTITQPKGGATIEVRETKDVAFDLFPSELALDNPKEGFQSGGVTVRGTLDPAKGLITGEQSFKGHYKESGNLTVPGTFVFKYTLTMTPPKK